MPELLTPWHNNSTILANNDIDIAQTLLDFPPLTFVKSKEKP